MKTNSKKTHAFLCLLYCILFIYDPFQNIPQSSKVSENVAPNSEFSRATFSEALHELGLFKKKTLPCYTTTSPSYYIPTSKLILPKLLSLYIF